MSKAMHEFVENPYKVQQLVWKGQPIPGYTIDTNGVLKHHGTACGTWLVNGRNYALVTIEGHVWQYRIDYMVAYTFFGMRPDALRLIHLNGNIEDDRASNLMWYRKSDIMKEYIDLAIVEPDGSIREEWRPCKTEYNDDLGYEVSNFGMIRDSKGDPIPVYENHGYRVFYYLDKTFGSKTRIKAVHRAVAEAFIPNPNYYSLVNHLDGNKFNDVVSNLEWASNAMNTEHAYLQGLNSGIKYTSEQIHNVCKLLATGSVPHTQISYMTGVERKTISDIYRGRRWKEISSQYKMSERKWTYEIRQKISDMIISGKKGKEIFSELGMEYNQSAISFYERIRRELKSQGKVA